MEILDLARKHSNYGFCAQYSIVYLRALRSLGLHARYIDTGHFLVSVWLDEQQKWAAMDPTNDWHFEKGGLALSGRQLAEASWSGDVKGIEVVPTEGPRRPATGEDVKVFRNFSLLLTDNQLTEPIEIEDNGRRRRHVLLPDYHAYPLVGRENVGYGADFLVWHHPGGPDGPSDRKSSDDPDDFRDRVNQTIIVVGEVDAARGRAKLRLLDEYAPEFACYVLEDDLGRHNELADSEVFWDLHPGLNTLSVRVKTKGGWLGETSVLKLYYKRDWLARASRKS